MSPRENHAGVKEVAEYSYLTSETYRKNLEELLGPQEPKFCPECDMRWSWCECKKENEEDAG